MARDDVNVARGRDIITTGTIDAQGNQTYKTVTPYDGPKQATPKEKRAEYLQKLGVYQAFLNQYPELKRLIERAIADYKNGKGWTPERFQAEYSSTKYATERTKSEEAFDLGMGGPDADVWNKKVADRVNAVKQDAKRLGIDLSDAEAQQLAKRAVRSDLTDVDMADYWSKTYGKDVGKTGDYGTASVISAQLKDMAARYGMKIDSGTLQRKTGDALAQGERWREYMEGQEEFFRGQAKLMFPNAAPFLDTADLASIAEPYFSTAADLLGIPADQMDLTDTKWSNFLNGDGRVLSKDEWERVIKTDPKYAYDQSKNAKQSYSGLAEGLAAAFGKA